MRLSSCDVRFVYDYGQVYLHDAERTWAEGYPEYVSALDDARARALSIGLADDLVDVLMPRQENFSARLSVEVWEGSPPIELEQWDHVVDFPIRVPSGRLVLSASGGSGDTEVSIPAGTFHARWCGCRFKEAEDWSYSDDEREHPPDEYRLQLWESDVLIEPTELKPWPGARMRQT